MVCAAPTVYIQNLDLVVLPIALENKIGSQGNTPGTERTGSTDNGVTIVRLEGFGNI